jgi:hypothetical protein
MVYLEGEDVEPFSFTVVTPRYLQRQPGPTWGHGYLILEVFDWHVVVRAVASLLAQAARPTWSEGVAALGQVLRAAFTPPFQT